MPSLNKLMVIANLGGNPELRFTPSGKPVCTFNVACNRVSYGQDNDKKEEVEWFSVVAWDKLAERCNQNLSKGMMVYVEGRFQSRSWEGQDGQKHTRSEIVANTVLFLSARKNGTSQEKGDSDLSPDDFTILP